MAVAKEILEKKFWSLSGDETLSTLETSESGLSDEEARRRLKIFGKNAITSGSSLTRFSIFISQFKNPLIFVLLIAGGITVALKDYHDAGFIFGAAFINAFLGFYQENKAERALEDLKTYVTQRVRVRRDGRESEIESVDLVPGDVVHLLPGVRVPADARLIYVNDVLVDQAILTGESAAVEKKTQADPVSAVVADRDSMVFSGTTIVSGVAEAVVVATDEHTELGKIARLVSVTEREITPLQQSIGRFSVIASAFFLLLSVAMFFIARGSGLSLLEAFLISVAVLVAAVPEGLPIVMTVILAIGVQRLARKNGVVRRLSAAETLGSTTVIMTDKTGTLTQAKMSVETVQSYGGDEATDFMVYTALLNADVVIENPHDDSAAWRIVGRPIDVAIVQAAAGRGLFAADLKEGKRAVHILPFNSKNKFAATVHPVSSRFVERVSKRDAHILSLFGAPEVLLGFTDYPQERKNLILADVERRAAAGERVVGVAYKEVENINDFSIKEHKHLSGVTFMGFIGFKDPLRPTVQYAMQQVVAAGISVVMVTGDHAATAVAVAKELGLDVSHEYAVLSGAELDAMSEEELARRVAHVKVISRVSPEGKMKVVRAFKKRGEVVAMNGDGINDAPALREADIGVAMGTGTDVAKDVADLVLLDDNFETIVAAVHEGHRILENIRKAIVYLFSTIFNEMFLIGGALLMGIAMPLNALQILWVNFFTDSFPGISLAFEDKIDKLSDRPAHVRQGIFTGPMRAFLLINSILSGALLLFTYAALIEHGVALSLAKTFIFGAFGVYSLFLIFAVRSLRRSIFHYNPFSNPSLLLSFSIGFASMMVAIYVPFFQKIFGTVALPAVWLWAVIGFGVASILLIELTKLALYHRDER